MEWERDMPQDRAEIEQKQPVQPSAPSHPSEVAKPAELSEQDLNKVSGGTSVLKKQKDTVNAVIGKI